MDEITIHVFVDADGNYQYNIYEGSPEDVATVLEDDMDYRCRDGGCCTTTMTNALDMAADQAKKLIV